MTIENEEDLTKEERAELVVDLIIEHRQVISNLFDQYYGIHRIQIEGSLQDKFCSVILDDLRNLLSDIGYIEFLI